MTDIPQESESAETVSASGPQGARVTLLWSFLKACCRIATTLLFDLKVQGKGHLPRTGGVLVVSNHQSYLDPILLAVQLPRTMSFLARSTLFDNPAFGWLIRSLNAFPVRQGEGDVGAIRETIRRLREGHLLNIFPEGSRCEDGEIGAIASGVALVIRRAGVPVVPAVIDGAFQAWPRHRRLFRAHPIRVMYGPVLDLAGKKPEQIARIVDQTLRHMHRELVRQGNSSAGIKRTWS